MRKIFAMLGLVLGVVAGSVALAPAAQAWSTQQSASAGCDAATGHAVLTATFKNTEPNRSSTSMRVTAVADPSDNGVTPDVALGTQDVAGGATVTFTADLGLAPRPAGTVHFALRWTDGHSGTDSRDAAYGAVAACKVPDVVKPSAAIYPGTCDVRQTYAVLDNRASNVAVTFAVNGAAYQVAAGQTQTVDLGAFEGSVTVSGPSGVLASATVSYASCPQDYEWRVKKQMMHGEGPKRWSGIVSVAPGTGVTVQVTRAPTYLRVVIAVDGLGVVFDRTMKATPGRTTVRVDAGSVSVEKYARLKGKAPQTATFTGAF